MMEKIQKDSKLILASMVSGGVNSAQAADALIKILGYMTERGGYYISVNELFSLYSDVTRHDKSREDMRYRFITSVKSIYIISQLIEKDFQRFSLPDSFFINSNKKFLFLLVELHPLKYQKKDYEDFTKILNRHFHMSIFVAYLFDGNLSISYMRRNQRRNYYQSIQDEVDMPEDTLGKLLIASNIDCENPHPIHLDIISELSVSAITENELYKKSSIFDCISFGWEYALRVERQYAIFNDELKCAVRRIIKFSYQNGYILDSIIENCMSNVLHYQDADSFKEIITSILGEDNINVCDEIPVENSIALRDNSLDLLDIEDKIDNQVEYILSHFSINGRLIDTKSIYENEINQFPLLTANDEQYIGRIIYYAIKKIAIEKKILKKLKQSDLFESNEIMEHKIKLLECEKNLEASYKSSGDHYHNISNLRDAVNIMINSNYKLVLSAVSRYQNNNISCMDLIQAGNLGLIRAVQKFNPTLMNRFSTYATHWIEHKIRREIANSGRIIRIPVYQHEKINKLNIVIRDITANSETQPTLDLLSKKMDMSEAEVRDLLNLREDQATLESCNSKEMNIELESMVDSSIADFFDFGGRKEKKRFLHGFFSGLKDREEEVIKKRFGIGYEKEYTLEKIGSDENVTRERIRQIQEKALKKLRMRHNSLYKKKGE